MAGTDNLTVHIYDPVSSWVKAEPVKLIDLKSYRPTDVIQILYQRGMCVTNPGGSIWRMGRCIQQVGNPNPVPGKPFAECTIFADPVNGVMNGDAVTVVEVPLP